MRSLAYAAAAIAAIGIMIFLASTPTDQPVIEPDASATASSSEPTEAPKASVAIPESPADFVDVERARNALPLRLLSRDQEETRVAG